MQLFSYNPHLFLSIAFPSFILLNICFICFPQHVIASQHVFIVFIACFLPYAMIYRFDVVSLAFLGLDMSKFHVCAQIHMFLDSLPFSCLCSLPCLCLDLHAYVFFTMFLLRSTSLCLDLCVYVLCAMLVCLDLCWLLCHVLLQPFLSLNISLSYILPLLVGCRSRSCGLGLHLYTQAYIKGFGSFSLHIYVCMLASILYLHVNLSRSRLFHACAPYGLVLVRSHPSLLGFVRM